MLKNDLKTVSAVVYLPRIYKISRMMCTTFTRFITTKLQKKRVQEPKLYEKDRRIKKCLVPDFSQDQKSIIL